MTKTNNNVKVNKKRVKKAHNVRAPSKHKLPAKSQSELKGELTAYRTNKKLTLRALQRKVAAIVGYTDMEDNAMRSQNILKQSIDTKIDLLFSYLQKADKNTSDLRIGNALSIMIPVYIEEITKQLSEFQIKIMVAKNANRKLTVLQKEKNDIVKQLAVANKNIDRLKSSIQIKKDKKLEFLVFFLHF